MQNNCGNMQNSTVNPCQNPTQNPTQNPMQNPISDAHQNQMYDPVQDTRQNQSGSFHETEVVYAGFWVRLGAYAIDMMIVFAGLLFMRLTMWIIMSVLGDTFLGGNILFRYTLTDIVLYMAQALYFILCTYFTGTTPGKCAMNLRVISADGQQKLTFLNVIYREIIGRFLSAFVFSVGYIMIAIDKQKRGLHDILCDTRVIYGKKVKVYPVYSRPVQPMPQAPVQPAQPSAPVPPQAPVQPAQPTTQPPVQPQVPVPPQSDIPVRQQAPVPPRSDAPVEPAVQPPADEVNDTSKEE